MNYIGTARRVVPIFFLGTLNFWVKFWIYLRAHSNSVEQAQYIFKEHESLKLN
jgi:hypothetical protein